jgi:hypothetical protein
MFLFIELYNIMKTFNITILLAVLNHILISMVL